MKKKIAYFNCTGVFPHIGCLAVTDSHMRELIAGGYDIFKIYSSLDTKFLRSKDRKISLGLAKTSSIKNVIESADALVIKKGQFITRAGATY